MWFAKELDKNMVVKNILKQLANVKSKKHEKDSTLASIYNSLANH